MTLLILGLIGFIGSHMVRVVADDWRTRTRERIGAQRYKAIYSLVSVISFGLMVWGYGSARHDSALLWVAPFGSQSSEIIVKMRLSDERTRACLPVSSF